MFDDGYDQWINQMPDSIMGFFKTQGYSEKINLIKSNCKSFQQFEKQLYVWFDGFLCLKFVHYARDNYYPNIPLDKAANQLIEINSNNPIDLLKIYRDIDA